VPTRRMSLSGAPNVVKRVAAVGAVVLAAAFVPGGARAAPIDTVRIVYQAFQSYGALFIADREGFFSAERIRLEWVPLRTSAEAIPLLAQGKLDVGAGGISPAYFNAVSRGLRVRIVADKGHVGPRGGVPVLMVRRGLAGVIKTVADLKGRKVAISGLGDLGHYLWYRTLTAHGLSLGDVTLVTLPLPAYVAALEGGSVDAAFLTPPQDKQAAEAGMAFTLADPADFMMGEPLAFLYYGPTFLERDRALGLRFMVAYLRGLRQYNAGPTERNVSIVAEYTKVDPALVRRSGWIGMRADGLVDVAKVRRLQDWLYEIELVSVRNPMQTVVDNSFVDQAGDLLHLRGTR